MLKMCVLKHQMLNKVGFNQSMQQYFLLSESQLCLDRIKHRHKKQKNRRKTNIVRHLLHNPETAGGIL